MDQFASRSDIPEKYRWNLDVVYSNADTWEQDFSKLDKLTEAVEAFRGKLTSNVQTLKAAFDAQSKLDLTAEKLYAYAHHLSDENTSDSTRLGRVDRTRSKFAEIGARLSWMDPELLTASTETLKSFQADPSMKEYSRRIELLIRSKPHQRSAEVEEILSLVSEPLSSASKTFSLLEDADMRVPNAKDKNGKEHPLNHSSYATLLESDDRTLRKSAYETYFGAYAQYKNTFASTLDGNVKKQVFYARVRKFPSAIEASLFSDTIPLQVYNGLIDTVHRFLPLMHRWVALKKKVLGLSEMHFYDQFVPMVKPAKVEVPYEEGAQWVIEAVKPLGAQYVETLKKAFSERWIDVYYTPGKRSGAYSGGMYLTHPYVLLNHKDNLGSTFTLAHELGHSLHSYFSNQSQPYSTANYPIFLAEVASTTNEMLLHFYLMDQAKTKEMRLYLLDHLFTQFRSTLYRQVQFAEFERDIHAMVERGEPLTADTLSAHYGELNRKYYGPSMSQNDLAQLEWARIPHFYYNFYVYKYSTSFAAAQFFARKLYEGDTELQGRYLEFLKAGSSRDPLDTLARAGVDMRTSQPIEAAFKVFEDAMDEFEQLIQK